MCVALLLAGAVLLCGTVPTSPQVSTAMLARADEEAVAGRSGVPRGVAVESAATRSVTARRTGARPPDRVSAEDLTTTRVIETTVPIPVAADDQGPASHARYGWPLRPVPRVARRFRAPPDPWSPGHRGADLVGSPGQQVLAARDGVVAFAGPLAGRGVVSVLHPDGLRTTYEPVTATVTVGTVIARGTVLGTLDPGHAGCPAAACLHWGVRRGEADYLDPLVLVGPGRVRLLPDTGSPR